MFLGWWENGFGNISLCMISATRITFLFEVGLQFQVIVQKNGHRDRTSTLACHNTVGVLGQQLKSDMLGDNISAVEIGKANPMKIIVGTDSNHLLRKLGSICTLILQAIIKGRK